MQETFIFHENSFFFLTILKFPMVPEPPSLCSRPEKIHVSWCSELQFLWKCTILHCSICSKWRKWTKEVDLCPEGCRFESTSHQVALSMIQSPHTAPRALLAHRAAPSSLRCWANASNSAVPPSYHPCTEAFMKYRWSNGFIDHRPRPSSGLSMCHSNSFLPSEDHIISRDPTVESVH